MIQNLSPLKNLKMVVSTVKIIWQLVEDHP